MGRNFYISKAYFKEDISTRYGKDFKIKYFQSKISLVVYYFYPYKSNICYHQKGEIVGL